MADTQVTKPNGGTLPIGETKNPQPVSKTARQLFNETATSVKLEIGDETVRLSPMTFSSGAVGWNGNGKIDVQGHRVQVSINLVVVGSKLWAK